MDPFHQSSISRCPCARGGDAEVGSVIAKIRADLSAFNRAFSDASRVFVRFKQQVKG
jgi:hypothetical protein